VRAPAPRFAVEGASKVVGRRNDGMDFEAYKKLVGYDKWESIDDRFAPLL
jgi:hypothetical protein